MSNDVTHANDRQVATTTSPSIRRTAWREHPAARVGRSLVSRPSGVVSAGFLFLLVIVAVTAPWITPYDPNVQDLPSQFQGPSLSHWLGTDQFGRDVFSRILFATRIAVIAPLIALGVALTLGLPSGLMAGYRRGRFDTVLSRFADTLLSIPPIIAAIALIAALGPGLVRAMVAIGIVYAPRIYRVVRASALSTSEETFMESARSIGASNRRIMWGHVLPNIMPPLLVQASLLMGFALLAESSLSFLGLGVQLPNASWGSMLRQASLQQYRSPYAVIPPGVILTLTILAFNTIGDVLRDSFADREAS